MYTFDIKFLILISVDHAAGDSMIEGGTAPKYSHNDTKQVRKWKQSKLEKKTTTKNISHCNVYSEVISSEVAKMR